jgi:hypothetical protein
MVCDVIMVTQQCYTNNTNPLLSNAGLTGLNIGNYKVINKIFSDYKPCQQTKTGRHFRDSLCPHYQGDVRVISRPNDGDKDRPWNSQF